MKKIVNTFVALIAVVGLATAQNVHIKDGLAYNEAGVLANGKYKIETQNQIKNVTFLQGMKNGACEVYASNGKLIESGSYKNDQKNGLWEKWNETGTKLGEVYFNVGQRDGKWKIWDNNGVLRYVMFYENGKKVGSWEEYNEKGEMINQKTYGEGL